MAAVARLGDSSSHGGTIVSASSDSFANGIAIAREGDLHSCPIHGHGTTALTSIVSDVDVDGNKIITVGAHAACGAIINSGSPDVTAQ
jgi:uncharacterized Zn-binding protein involved in type VI secretion